MQQRTTSSLLAKDQPCYMMLKSHSNSKWRLFTNSINYLQYVTLPERLEESSHKLYLFPYSRPLTSVTFLWWLFSLCNVLRRLARDIFEICKSRYEKQCEAKPMYQELSLSTMAWLWFNSRSSLSLSPSLHFCARTESTRLTQTLMIDHRDVCYNKDNLKKTTNPLHTGDTV